MALETALKALLSIHAVCSWKITGDGPNPCVILRLRAENQQNACTSGVHADSVTYRRKPPRQILRDRRRVEDFRQRRENENEKVTVLESRVASQSDTENELNTEIIKSAPSEILNTKVDSSVVHTSPNNATDNTERAARSGEAETATVTREDGGHGSESSDMETDDNSSSDTDSTESEDKQSTRHAEIARDLANTAKNMRYMPDNLRNEFRNNDFEKVVIDWRDRDVKLLCISRDFVATRDIRTGETNFELRNHEGGRGFWHFWSDIDQNGERKETIDEIRSAMKEVLSRVRKRMSNTEEKEVK